MVSETPFVRANEQPEATAAGAAPSCAVCGGARYGHTPVLWDALVGEWQLSPDEARYIDIQQGTCCTQCGCNVRSIALAKALSHAISWEGNLAALVASKPSLRTLEVNEAGHLSRYLRQIDGHRLIEYPEFDLMDLRLPSGAFDMVVHSDTLEHVPDPIRALAECRRVLTREGALVFSVPVVMGRVSRSRVGLPPSYHGPPGNADEALRVQTEFGADVWATVMRAGFDRCEFVSFMFPSGIALVAR